MKIEVDKLIQIDPWLTPYRKALEWRGVRVKDRLSEFKHDFGSLDKFSQGYKYYGFNAGSDRGKRGVWYREWAPEALSLALIGDFNDWNRTKHPMKKNEFGVWEIFVQNGSKFELKHGSRVKVNVAGKLHRMDKIPAYIQKVEPDDNNSYTGVYWQPKKKYRFKHRVPKINTGLKIYEAHVGMAQEKEGVGRFDEFAAQVLPRITKQGYNAVQLMAIAQHPYYGSFGYQVSNYFAVSHYFGDPDDLKKLIDDAHGLGLLVLIDLVHSHAVKNLAEGLNEFDGSDHQYFYEGPQGNHPGWDTKLFDYGKVEVLRFLLSNVRFWMNEFSADGFRFDGVTSMLFKDRGLGKPFDHYDRYFSPDDVDENAVTYLSLANLLAHELNPKAVTIAEDVSGMPGLARPVNEGGLGFDYRLAMGIPDYWIEVVKHQKDDDWRMENIFNVLRNRRYKENHIAYTESHDQALVGDKTLAFRLMDQEMYWNMHRDKQSVVIDRGLALHKLIRLVTFFVGGEGWLNFMGNEFGHPEWIDFPRPGNNFSYFYARRQWSLVDNPELKYQDLNNFDRELNQTDKTLKILADPFIELIAVNEAKKLLVCRRGPLVLAVNFHPSQSYPNLAIGVPDFGDYKITLSTDEMRFGGFGRIKQNQVYPVKKKECQGRTQSILIYAPSRTGQILRPIKRHQGK